MSDDTYDGWTNRETWALNLWLTNDQSLYEMTRERVAERLESNAQFHRADDAEFRARIAGEVVKSLWEDLTDPADDLEDPIAIIGILQDVGSEYRVNWDEIGAAWLEDLDES